MSLSVVLHSSQCRRVLGSGVVLAAVNSGCIARMEIVHALVLNMLTNTLHTAKAFWMDICQSESKSKLVKCIIYCNAHFFYIDCLCKKSQTVFAWKAQRFLLNKIWMGGKKLKKCWNTKKSVKTLTTRKCLGNKRSVKTLKNNIITLKLC